MIKRLIIIGIAVAAVAGVGFLLFQRSEDRIINDRPISASLSNVAEEAEGPVENGGYKTVFTSEVPGSSSELSFSFSMPLEWEVEAITSRGALNLYNPRTAVEGDETESLDQSQIFITFFEANDFQKPESVSILSREDHGVVGLPAVTYIINQKESSGGDKSEPFWLDSVHRTTVVRLSSESPSVFLVFAKRPELSLAEFEHFLNSLNFDSDNQKE